jgi:hypothetical protein
MDTIVDTYRSETEEARNDVSQLTPMGQVSFPEICIEDDVNLMKLDVALRSPLIKGAGFC